ncbi:Transposon-encoded protein TnpW, partial [Dysosmobacter welbionis]
DVVPAAGLDGPLQDGEGLVRHDQFRIHLQLAAQARTGGTGTEGVVEGEHPGRQLLDGDAAVLA